MAKLESITSLKSQLQGAYSDDLDAMASQPYIPPQAQLNKNRFSPFALAASLAVEVAVGLMGHKVFIQNSQPDWVSQMANYQAMYAPATLANAATPADVIAKQLQDWESALGSSISAPDLTDKNCLLYTSPSPRD